MKIFVHMPYAFNAFYGKSAYIFTVDSLSIHSAVFVFFVVREKWNNIIAAQAGMLFFLLPLSNCAIGKISFLFLHLISAFLLILCLFLMFLLFLLLLRGLMLRSMAVFILAQAKNFLFMFRKEKSFPSFNSMNERKKPAKKSSFMPWKYSRKIKFKTMFVRGEIKVWADMFSYEGRLFFAFSLD